MPRILTFILACMVSATSALADIPRVVTDIPAVHSLVKMVMGDLGEPSVLVTAETDPHHMQLRPSQVRTISQADIVFWIGPELTPWLEATLLTVGKSLTNIALIDADGITLRLEDDGKDPHVWLDPMNAIQWLTVIEQALSSHDSDNQPTYAANAANSQVAITALISETAQKLQTTRDARLIAAHDAYGYFADRFGLNIVATLADSDANSPGAARMAELRSIVKDGGISCVFAEPFQNPVLVQTIIEGTETPIGLLDPSGTTLPPSAELYPTLIRNLADNITACVSGTQ